MSISANNALDEHKALEELKKCPKIVRDYVKCLKYSLEQQQKLTNRAIGKIQELSKSSKND